MNGTIDIDTAVELAATDHPALAQLLAGYFHQDWQEDYASPEAAVAAFADDAAPETAVAAAGDIDQLLDGGLDEAALTRVLADGFDCNYVPATDGLTSAAWLAAVRDALRPKPN
jgi:hypothetical protein